MDRSASVASIKEKEPFLERNFCKCCLDIIQASFYYEGSSRNGDGT